MVLKLYDNTQARVLGCVNYNILFTYAYAVIKVSSNPNIMSLVI